MGEAMMVVDVRCSWRNHRATLDERHALDDWRALAISRTGAKEYQAIEPTLPYDDSIDCDEECHSEAGMLDGVGMQ